MKNTVESNLNARNNNFDFIRFVAALLVIYAHSYPLCGFMGNEPFMIFTKNYLNFGTLSVIIFFIISGFLITSSFDRGKRLKTFFIARVLRIYPALIFVVVFTVFVLGPILTKDSPGAYFSNKLTYSYLINCFCLKTINTLPGIFVNNPISVVNGPLWSLPYELSCYGLVAFIGLIARKNYKNSIFALFIVVLIYYFIGFEPWKNIIQYSFYFFCGALIYLFRKKIVLNYLVALFFLCILILSLHLNINKHIKDIILCLTLPYIIISFAFIKGFLNHFAKYGDFSYGIYIFGWLVQQIFVQTYPEFSPAINFIFSSIITLILAFLSWHFIEKKSLLLKRKFV